MISLVLVTWGAISAVAGWAHIFRHGWDDGRAYGWFAAANLLYMLMNLARREWGWAAMNAAFAAIIGGSWWNRRGRRAARRLGAKSRALVAALVRALKPAPRLRPVRSPA